jgi:hypothetical protein
MDEPSHGDGQCNDENDSLSYHVEYSADGYYLGFECLGGYELAVLLAVETCD